MVVVVVVGGSREGKEGEGVELRVNKLGEN